MRPIQRGASPIGVDYSDYRDAYPNLVSRLGHYCSYCERRILTNLAVEHIQPKGLPQYAALAGRWDNFLLGCVNCNSTKKDKNVQLDQCYLPDRDNTFHAYTYTADGLMGPSNSLSPTQKQMANETLKLTGLDKPASNVVDENGVFVAVDRVRQRKEIWDIAELDLQDYQDEPTEGLKRCIINNAVLGGAFSIWMAVFEQHKEMRQRFIRAFPSTADDCFDLNTDPITPRPDAGLAHSSKI